MVETPILSVGQSLVDYGSSLPASVKGPSPPVDDARTRTGRASPPSWPEASSDPSSPGEIGAHDRRAMRCTLVRRGGWSRGSILARPAQAGRQPLVGGGEAISVVLVSLDAPLEPFDRLVAERSAFGGRPGPDRRRPGSAPGAPRPGPSAGRSPFARSGRADAIHRAGRGGPPSIPTGRPRRRSSARRRLPSPSVAVDIIHPFRILSGTTSDRALEDPPGGGRGGSRRRHSKSGRPCDGHSPGQRSAQPPNIPAIALTNPDARRPRGTRRGSGPCRRRRTRRARGAAW